MKKYTALLMLFLFTGTIVFAQNKKSKPAVAVAETTPTGDVLHLSTTEHDFGKIPQGKPVTHIFMLENRSNDTLRIEHVQASCGCTTPEYKTDPVLPGGSTPLKVGYNAAAEGAFDKLVTIYYNGGKTKVLHIKGTVWKTPDQPVPANQALNVFKQNQ